MVVCAMKFDYLVPEKWFGQNQTSRTGSAAPEP